MDLRQKAMQKQTMIILYKHDTFNIAFDEYREKLLSWLSDLIPKRSAKDAKHYKSFLWRQYKVDYDYTDSGDIKITLEFLASIEKQSEIKNSIITMVEGLCERKKKKEG